MRQSLKFLGLALTLAASASACAVPTNPTTNANGVAPAAAPATPTAGQVPVFSGGPWIDNGQSPTRAEGATSAQIVGATQSPHVSDGTGNFRTFCFYSHMAFDDPIVAPGQPGASHLHTFFGNTTTDAFSTADSIANSGASTCRGGILNRSAYWVPSMIDTSTGAPLQPSYMIAYYKTGYGGVDPWEVVAMPAGLRMIAGRPATATEADPNPAYLRHLSWRCTYDQRGNGTDTTPGMQQCSPGSWVTMGVGFPQCWDGRNLDSPDHRSHMAYPDGSGCPASHPVALPAIGINVSWQVPSSGNGSWRLSSDTYSGGEGGYSGHADWWNGWDPATMQTWIDNCLRQGLDCDVEVLGNSTQLG